MPIFSNPTHASGHTLGRRLGLLSVLLAAGLHGLPLIAQDAETIARIEVVGASKQTTETVIYKAGVREGDDLRTVDLTAVLERLWASGSFDDVKLEVEEIAGGKKLVIRVTERPVIKEVDYRGGTLVGLSSIKDKIKDSKDEIKPDSLYDPEAARRVKEMIVDKCAEKGFRNPVVTIDLEPIGPGLVRLIYDVKEGGKTRIYKIDFRGNHVISDKKLLKALQNTKARTWIRRFSSKSLLVDKNLEGDEDNLKKTYWRIGYKDVFVGQPIIEVEDYTSPRQKRKNQERIEEGKSPKYDLRATVTVPILEGDQYFEGSTRIEGTTKVFKDKRADEILKMSIAEARRDHGSRWRKFFDIKPSAKDFDPKGNRPFDLDAINEGIEKTREVYGNNAYVSFGAEKKLTVREEDGVKKVDTVVAISEGEAYRVRRIAFEGNTNTKDKVIRRAMLLKEGEPFRLDLFRESFTSIGQLGYYDIRGQEPKVDFVPDKPLVDVTLRGQEAGTNEIMFQGGYGSVFGFSFGASYSTRNLGGGGETLSVSVDRGQYRTGASVSYTEPYLFDLPYSLSSSLSDMKSEYDESKVGEDNSYTQKTQSLSTVLGIRLSNWFPEPIWAFYTTYRVGFSVSRDNYQGGSNYLYRNIGTINTATIINSIEYNTINHPFKPTRGISIGVGFDFAGWASDRPYHRTSVDFTKYTHIGDRHVFGVNVGYDYINNLGSKALPYFYYYKPGGENSIRGYSYGQVGSIVYDNGDPVVVGGVKQLIANFEYQFKITEDIRAVLFYDAGNAWGPGERMFSSKLVTYSDPEEGILETYQNPKLLQSYGVELRIFVPLSPAPLRFIWARKKNPYPWDRDSVTDFQFSLGTTF